MSTAELVSQIEAARMAGDLERLADLQAEYRRSGGEGIRVSADCHLSGAAVLDRPEVPRVLLRHTRSPYRVVLSGYADGRIRDELLTVEAGIDEARETGGWLAGQIVGKTIEVTLSTGAGEDAERKFGWVEFDEDYLDGHVRAALEPGEILLGDFHSHPRGSGSPSEQDRRSWVKAYERFASPIYVGMIATPPPLDTLAAGDWSVARLRAWVVRDDGGTTVIEPAQLEES